MISDHRLLASVTHWRELPFKYVWVIDSEFYPGRGLNNGGRGGTRSPLYASSRSSCEPDELSGCGKTNLGLSRLIVSGPIR
jgi:hypothetical protein